MNVRNTQLPIYAFLGLYVDPTISDKIVIVINDCYFKWIVMP